LIPGVTIIATNAQTGVVSTTIMKRKYGALSFSRTVQSSATGFDFVPGQNYKRRMVYGRISLHDRDGKMDFPFAPIVD